MQTEHVSRRAGTLCGGALHWIHIVCFCSFEKQLQTERAITPADVACFVFLISMRLRYMAQVIEIHVFSNRARQQLCWRVRISMQCAEMLFA
jgi:hypothetical protein